LHICKAFFFFINISLLKRIFLTVTNDLSYDQRMHRICTSLATNGYMVTLVGRKLSTSLPLAEKKYKQKRLRCFFNKGKAFYAEYNCRLFFFLLFRRMDAICAIDLDSIIPCYYISKLKAVVRIYDAHELFTEQKEIITRPRIQRWWKKIEAKYVPAFKYGYTVSESITTEFFNRYDVKYGTIQNIPVLKELNELLPGEKIILYQGAVNEARGFESLIPAMQQIPYTLVICGDGNFMQQVKELITRYDVSDKVVLKGMLPPAQLWQISQQAFIGINLVENNGLNQYYSLANKFFDYIHAGLPQVTMNFPEYKKINDQYAVAELITETEPKIIAAAVNKLANDTVLYNTLKENCLKARHQLNWQQEEKKLLSFYQSVFTT
jgi:glycosyltransferase involved in cell wall biosynthesis